MWIRDKENVRDDMKSKVKPKSLADFTVHVAPQGEIYSDFRLKKTRKNILLEIYKKHLILNVEQR